MILVGQSRVQWCNLTNQYVAIRWTNKLGELLVSQAMYSVAVPGFIKQAPPPAHGSLHWWDRMCEPSSLLDSLALKPLGRMVWSTPVTTSHLSYLTLWSYSQLGLRPQKENLPQFLLHPSLNQCFQIDKSLLGKLISWHPFPLKL